MNSTDDPRCLHCGGPLHSEIHMPPGAGLLAYAACESCRARGPEVGVRPEDDPTTWAGAAFTVHGRRPPKLTEVAAEPLTDGARCSWCGVGPLRWAVTASGHSTPPRRIQVECAYCDQRGPSVGVGDLMHLPEADARIEAVRRWNVSQGVARDGPRDAPAASNVGRDPACQAGVGLAASVPLTADELVAMSELAARIERRVRRGGGACT